jgi:outer membrane protein assembly factor BamB
VPGEPTAVVGPKSYDPTPAISGGMLYVGSVNSAFYAFSLATRKQVWSFDPPQPDGPSGQQVFTSATVAGGIVYVGATNNKYYALDAATGDMLWRFKDGSAATGSEIMSGPAVSGGVVYVTDNHDNVLTLDANTGDQRWSASVGGTGSAPAVAKGVVYVGSGSQEEVYALNAANGRKLRSFNVNDGPNAFITSSPAIAGSTVYVTAGLLDAFSLR